MQIPWVAYAHWATLEKEASEPWIRVELLLYFFGSCLGAVFKYIISSDILKDLFNTATPHWPNPLFPLDIFEYNTIRMTAVSARTLKHIFYLIIKVGVPDCSLNCVVKSDCSEFTIDKRVRTNDFSHTVIVEDFKVVNKSRTIYINLSHRHRLSSIFHYWFYILTHLLTTHYHPYQLE